MCGISLIFHSDGKLADKKAINSMVAALYHRGPDAQNAILRDNTALGHTRLSIVDVKGGAQPMVSADGRYAITFNGEIYNYQSLRNQLEQQNCQFQTQSDTEVILHLFAKYQGRCVNHLIGMFSFAIHDQQTGNLFVARDRLGIKPLFYHWNGKTLCCASEMKALFASGYVEAKFNFHSLQNYFIYQFSISPFTPFESVFELPPGHTLQIGRDGEPDIKQYWDLEFPNEGEYEDLEEHRWLARFEEALHDVTQTHMIGEVPIGAYLSGGIDSSATSYMLKEHYPGEVQTFTMQFTNTDNDESVIARSIADHLNLSNKAVVLDDERPGGYLNVLVNAMYHVEQPQRMALDVPYYLLSGLVKENKYKVVYTGDGADEILGGYDCYRQDAIREWGNNIDDEQEKENVYLNYYKDSYADQFMRMLLRLHAPDSQQKTIKKFGCYPVWYDYWHILEDKMQGLFSETFEQQAKSNQQMDLAIEKMKPRLLNLDPLNQSLYMETKTRLPGWVLWKSDRMSMAHGVEARVPFMDHTFVEMTAKIPPELKLNGMDEKYILRKILLPHLPQHPTQFKKRAFYTPIREWFFTENKRAELDQYLSINAIEAAGVFDSQRVLADLDELLATKPPESINDYYRIMKLEWVLLSVLSIQILHHLFVQRKAPCFAVETKT